MRSLLLAAHSRQQFANAGKAEVVDLRLVSSRGRGVLTKHTGVLSMCDVELVGIAVTHIDRTQKSMSRRKRSPRMKRVGNRDSEWSWRRVARPRFRRDSNHVVRRTTRICAWAPCGCTFLVSPGSYPALVRTRGRRQDIPTMWVVYTTTSW